MGCINSTAARNSASNDANNKTKNCNVKNGKKRTKNDGNSNGLTPRAAGRCGAAHEPCTEQNCKTCCSSAVSHVDAHDRLGNDRNDAENCSKKKRAKKINKMNKKDELTNRCCKNEALRKGRATNDALDDWEDPDDCGDPPSRVEVQRFDGGKGLREPRPRAKGKPKTGKTNGGARAMGDGAGTTSTHATKTNKLRLPFGSRASKNPCAENSELVGSKLAFTNEDPATSPTMPNGSSSSVGSINRAFNNKSQSSQKTCVEQNGFLAGSGSKNGGQRAPCIPEDSNGDPQTRAESNGTTADFWSGNGAQQRLVATQVSKK